MNTPSIAVLLIYRPRRSGTASLTTMAMEQQNQEASPITVVETGTNSESRRKVHLSPICSRSSRVKRYQALTQCLESLAMVEIGCQVSIGQDGNGFINLPVENTVKQVVFHFCNGL